MNLETLWKNKWISIRKRPDGYTYLHEDRCNGMLVAVLPFKFVKDNMCYLARFEVIPPHLLPEQTLEEGSKNPAPSCITGGVDIPDPLDLSREVLRELEEEAGYIVDKSKLIELGSIKQSKIADTIIYLFAVNVTGMEKVKPPGDGSKLEKIAKCKWVTEPLVIWGSDPIMPVIILRLKDVVNSKRTLIKG